MKGLFQTALAFTAITGVFAGPMKHHHRRHHDKRALVIITRTQEIVEIEYVYSTIYVPENKGVLTTSTIASTTSSETSSTTTSNPTTSSTSTSSTSSVAEALAAPQITSTTPVGLPTQVIPVVVPFVSSTSTSTSTTTTPPPAPVDVFTPVKIPSPLPSPQPQPQLNSLGSGDKQIYYGSGTYYDCGMGSCGLEDNNDSFVVAMSKERMLETEGANPNLNTQCGKKVRVYSDMAPDGVVFTIRDKCPGCPGRDDLDMCRNAFLANLGTEAQGRIKIWWHFE